MYIFFQYVEYKFFVFYLLGALKNGGPFSWSAVISKYSKDYIP